MELTITTASGRIRAWEQAIQQGLVLILPVVILAALSLVLLQLLSFFPALAQSPAHTIIDSIYQACSGTFSVWLVGGVAYRLSGILDTANSNSQSAFIAALLSIVSFLGVVAVDTSNSPMSDVGVERMGQALITAILATELYRKLYHSFSNRVFSWGGGINRLHEILRGIYVAILVPCVFVLLYTLLLKDAFFFERILPLVVGVVDSVDGLSYWQSVKIILVNQVSWFFGVHGSAVIGSGVEHVFVSNNDVIFSKEFLDVYAYPGGAGATLGLVFIMLFSRLAQLRNLSRYAFVPSLLNINEIILFGIPIVFNRYFLLPFILAPVIAMTVARMAVEVGAMGYANGLVQWSTPIFISGYFANGGLGGVFVQAVSLALVMAIYYPFLRRYEQSLILADKEAKKFMLYKVTNANFNIGSAFYKNDELGLFLRRLSEDILSSSFAKGLQVHYQPKVDVNGRVIGSEALLRWHHPYFGSIPTGCIVGIAELNGAIHEVGFAVIEQVFTDINRIKHQCGYCPKVAINASPHQLREKTFADHFSALMKKHNIRVEDIEVEVTENQKISYDDSVVHSIEVLSKKGISISIDDFGMGYTSLRYLKFFTVNAIKIDYMLVADVVESDVLKRVIKSIGFLAASMNMKLVAEWVETEEQFQVLKQLGCHQFQGSLFSMAVPAAELIALCQQDQVIRAS